MDKPARIKKRQRQRKNLFNGFLFITILSIVFIVLFKTSLFNVKDIQVVGNYRMLKEDIISFSKIKEEENIFKIKTNIAKENILSLPYTKDIKVKRKLPSTVILELIERKDVAFIKNDSVYEVIDIDGYVLRQVGVQDDELPTIFGMDIGNIGLRENVFEKFKVHTLSDFIEESIKLNMFFNMESIDLESVKDVEITLKNNIHIAFGPLDDVKYKLRLLNEVLNDISKKEIICRKIIMNKGDHPIIITDD